MFACLTALLVHQNVPFTLFHTQNNNNNKAIRQMTAVAHAFLAPSYTRRNRRIPRSSALLWSAPQREKHSASRARHKRKKQNPLTDLQKTLLQPTSPVLLIVDANNVRGKNDFSWTYRDLMDRLQNQWSEHDNQDKKLHILCVVDHGCRPEAFTLNPQLSVVFAGPHRTADDVIVQSCEWFRTATAPMEQSSSPSIAAFFKHIVVATSDGELRRRCLGCNNNQILLARRKRQRQRGATTTFSPLSTARIQVVTSMLFLNYLQQQQQQDEEEQSPPQGKNNNHDDASLSTSIQDTTSFASILNNLYTLEQDLRWYQFTKPPWNSGHEKALAQDLEPWDGRHLFSSADVAPSTENSTVIPPTVLRNKPFSEKTWHRIVFAEHWRRGLAECNLEPTMAFDSPSAGSGIWNKFRDQYNTPNEGDSHEQHVSVSLFQDTRISFQPDQQAQMLEYLQQSISSVSNILTEDDETDTMSSNSSALPLQLDHPQHSTLSLSPYAQAQEAMREFIKSSPSTCTQQHLLSRYKNEAPRHLQFSRQKDLRDLLNRVAEQRKDTSTNKKTWYVKEVQQDEDEDDGLWTEPGRGRFGSSRKRGGPKLQDPSILQQGENMEQQWLRLLRESSSLDCE